MSTIKSIDPMTASEWLNEHEAVLIDVREPAEYNEIHIPGAYLMPLNTVSIAKLPSNIGDKKIIVYCVMGKRSSIACAKLLLEKPALDIYNLDGGIIAWENSRLKCEKKH